MDEEYEYILYPLFGAQRVWCHSLRDRRGIVRDWQELPLIDISPLRQGVKTMDMRHKNSYSQPKREARLIGTRIMFFEHFIRS